MTTETLQDKIDNWGIYQDTIIPKSIVNKAIQDLREAIKRNRYTNNMIDVEVVLFLIGEKK